jgi:hypothetical protein
MGRVVALLVDPSPYALDGSFGAGGAGISLSGLDNSIFNDGMILGGDGGGLDANGGAGVEILSGSVVENITNLGLMLGGAGFGSGFDGYGVQNYGGTLSTLANAQGGISGGGSVAGLTYSGNLPSLYDIILSSGTSYGELNVTDGVGVNQMTVGVSDLSADLSTRFYASVITGVDATQMTNEGEAFTITNGVFGVVTGADVENHDIWDLRVWNFAADVVNPQQYVLQRNAANQRNALRYDCNMFAVNGSCVTSTLRQVDAGDAYGVDGGTPQFQGMVATAISLDPTLRIGGFVEFGGTQDNVPGVTFTSQGSTIGAFVGFGGNADGTGLRTRIAASYQSQTADITRADPLANGSFNSGSTSFASYGVTAEVNWAKTLGSNATLTPYLGVVATQASRASYQESNGEDPIAFGTFTESQVTGTAGLRFDGMVAQNVTYRIGAGIEQDLSHSLSGFDVTNSWIDTTYQGLETSSATRFLGQVGMSYLLAPNQELTIDGQVNQFGENSTDYALSVGFRLGY